MGTPCVTPEMVREAQVRLKGIAQKPACPIPIRSVI